MILRTICIYLLTITLSVPIAILAQGKSFAKGTKVDVFQKDRYYKASVLDTSKCYKIDYDDGTADVQVAARIASSGDRDTIGKVSSLSQGDAVEVLWKDNNWYNGTVSSTENCYRVTYIGWPKDQDEWTAASNVFPNDSKVKGDTSQKALQTQSSSSVTSMFQGDTGQKRNYTVGYASDGSYTDDAGNKISAEKVKQCLSTADEGRCRSTSQCRYDFSKRTCGPGGP